MPSNPSAHAKVRTARTTILVAGSLAAVKAVTWLITGSGGVLGSALDSALDLFASLFVLLAILGAQRPPDADHPWGHGKAEGLASLLQSVVILGSGVGLLVESWLRYESGEELGMPGVGIGVMVLSIVVTIWWTRRLQRAAADTGSLALEADSAHYASDVTLNVGVIVGLGLSVAIGARWPDLVVSVAIAAWILRTAVQVFRRAVAHLMDAGLEPEEQVRVLEVVRRFRPEVTGFHELRSRRSGSDVFLELHLDVDRTLSFVEAHEKGEAVRVELEREIRGSRVTIHADPL